MISLLPILVISSLSSQSSLQDFSQPRLHSMSLKAAVVVGNQYELKKISEDFGKNYAFEYANVEIEDPFKLRIESVVQGQSLLAIENGDHLLYRVPHIGLNKRENLSTAPGRRQSFLDFGLISEAMATSFFNSKFIRLDRATGDDVFDLTYASAPRTRDTTRFRVWVDPVKHYVTRREWYGQLGDFRATFYYSNPKEFDGVWIPTILEVKNADDKLAGKLKYENVKVNVSFPESEFDAG